MPPCPASSSRRVCVSCSFITVRGTAIDYIERAHGNLVAGVDQPIAALIADLKERGLLESTPIVWCGEFGRTPDNGVRGGTAYGRDHNPNAMTIWLAGGGCKAGHTIGATDELGMEASKASPRPRFSTSPFCVCWGWMTTSSPSTTAGASSSSASSANRNPGSDRMRGFRVFLAVSMSSVLMAAFSLSGADGRRKLPIPPSLRSRMSPVSRECCCWAIRSRSATPCRCAKH